MENELQELGLTENESKIYLFLLQKGECTTGPIIKETNIANSRVYESLNSLQSKGLVTYNLQKEGKYFQAVSPSIFKEKEEERKKKIESIIPSLLSMQSNHENKTKTAIYEGFEGFKTAFKKIIDDCPKKGVIKVIGFSEQEYAPKTLRTFLSNMNLKSIAKKQKLQIILGQDTKEGQGKEREKEKNMHVRYMPKGYISPIALDIFEDYVYMFLWEEKPFCFMVKNKAIAQSFKVYFDFLWHQAKPNI